MLTRGQAHYFATVLAGVVCLQAALFWGLASDIKGACNAFTAWPSNWSLPEWFFVGVTILVVALSVSFLKESVKRREILALALISATGISHSIERVSSGCVFDYWQVPGGFLGSIFINLGDVFLTTGVLLLLIGQIGFFAKK